MNDKQTDILRRIFRIVGERYELVRNIERLTEIVEDDFVEVSKKARMGLAAIDEASSNAIVDCDQMIADALELFVEVSTEPEPDDDDGSD